jgi:hypothetical protein
MTLSFDTATKKVSSLHVNTYMDDPKDVVTLAVQMASLPRSSASFFRRWAVGEELPREFSVPCRRVHIGTGPSSALDRFRSSRLKGNISKRQVYTLAADSRVLCFGSGCLSGLAATEDRVDTGGHASANARDALSYVLILA